MMNQGIILFSVGPVQTFIAEARKLKDLYAGSYLLSYIIKQVVAELQKNEVEIVFPQPDYPSMPNRVICMTSYDQEAEIERLAEKITNTAQCTLKNIAQTIATKYDIQSDYFDDEIAHQLEIYWVAKKVTDYQQDYQQLQTDMRRVKRLRTFSYKEYPSGKNCSLNSSKRAIFTLKDEDDKHNKRNGLMEGAVLLRASACGTALKKNEALSSSAFIKRFLSDAKLDEYNARFPSVCNIAIGNRLEIIGLDVDDNEASGILQLSAGNQLDKHEFTPDEEEHIHHIFACIQQAKIPLTEYYAVIKFDGDSIGNLYNKATIKPQKDRKEFHKFLSEEIMRFAQKVKGKMKKGDGVIVYAGGEDFLGFVSIDALFPVLSSFRRAFDSIDISEYVEDRKLTFSAGITIAHYHEMLEDVMRDVNQAEEFAKEIDEEKDATAIFLNIRAGETVKTRIKFGNECENLELIERIIRNLKEKKVSNSFIYNLKTCVSKMEAEWAGDEDTCKEFVYLETARLLYATTSEEENFDELISDFRKLLDNNRIDDYINWLLICTFLQREVI